MAEPFQLPLFPDQASLTRLAARPGSTKRYCVFRKYVYSFR